MKKIILVLFAFVVLLAIADDDPDYYYDDYPYTCVVDKTTKVITVTFADGSIRNFYYCNFENTHMKVTDAMAQYGGKYGNVQQKMIDEGISEKFYSENMSRWAQVVQSMLYYGQAKQQEKEYEKQAELLAAFQDNLLTDAQYIQGLNESQEKVNTLSANYDSAISGISTSMSQSIASLQQQLTAANEQQTIKMQELKNAIEDGTSAEITECLASSQKLAIDIAALKKSISDLQTTTTKRAVPIIATGDVSKSVYTNNMNAISKWLGNTNNAGAFLPPCVPWDVRCRYDKQSNNIAMWLADMGIVGYWNAKLSTAYYGGHADRHSLDNFYGHDSNDVIFASWFWDSWEDGGETNVVATFSAPTNWVDNVTIVCSDGVYTALASAIDIYGTDGSHALATNRLTFASATNANVKVSVSGTNGNATVTIGVYWLEEEE